MSTAACSRSAMSRTRRAGAPCGGGCGGRHCGGSPARGALACARSGRDPGGGAANLPAGMRQLLQNVSTGEIGVEDVPPPTADRASLLVATRFSLISAGTERAAVALGRQSLVGKARSRPDLVAKVLESARTEGIATTYAKVRGRLGEPNALGYSLS